MTRSDVDELIVDLYLRLNGYFTTGLIVHSPDWGQAKTEIDRLAVRHELHSQDERLVETSEFLRLQNKKSELLFCEVKSNVNSLQFNKALLQGEVSISTVLTCAGLVLPQDIGSLSKKLLKNVDQANKRHEGDDTRRYPE